MWRQRKEDIKFLITGSVSFLEQEKQERVVASKSITLVTNIISTIICNDYKDSISKSRLID